MMDLKIDLQRWHDACQAYDDKQYLKALDILLTCRPSSKTFFNLGVILVTLYDHQHALTMFAKAIELDPYFSAAYFQSGVSNVMLDNLDQAVECFDSAFKNLRGNKAINYRQLGLDFTLYACEILYNRGICQAYLGNTQCGMDDLTQAQQLKMNHQHDIIDRAAQHHGQFTFGVYSLPPGIIYRLTKCQLQLLNETEVLSILYHSAHGIFLFDQPHHQQKGINFTTSATSRIDHRGIPKYLAKYLTPSSSSPTAISTKAIPPPLPKYIPPTSLPYLSMAPKPSTSPAPPPFMQQQNNSNKLKLKLHYKDTRILVMNFDSTFQDLLTRTQEKLDIPADDTHQLGLYVKDPGNAWVPITNDSDWTLAKRRPSTSSCNGRTPMNKIEIWCKALKD
ncbi:hypothetical protein BCR42DRAFT_358443 [Absidia repens]|uniref:PB1 domain-containing protein n=1 Tax=Absidia repens TaxID=90262 RepID=A0A1X2I5H5_9FUNG|nr:hypothetical protein BCR42DRAFT_358443 [Absidia repens]